MANAAAHRSATSRRTRATSTPTSRRATTCSSGVSTAADPRARSGDTPLSPPAAFRSLSLSHTLSRSRSRVLSHTCARAHTPTWPCISATLSRALPARSHAFLQPFPGLCQHAPAHRFSLPPAPFPRPAVLLTLPHVALSSAPPLAAPPQTFLRRTATRRPRPSSGSRAGRAARRSSA